MKKVKINDITISNNLPFVLIAGPCAIESLDHALFMSNELQKICKTLSIPLIYKSSFDKANRSSIDSDRGVGLKAGLETLRQVKQKIKCPVLTDVHETTQVNEVASVVDVLQIPAFLCRQTDLLVACGNTGLPVNVKKGQFLSPEDMKNIIDKIESTGNKNILLTERGTSFGYKNLVVDYRSIDIMKEFGYPIVMDGTHSVQRPSGNGKTSGGDRKYVPALTKAAMVQGIGSVFIECHQDPDNSPSDGPNMIPLNEIEELLSELKDIDRLIKK